MFDAVRTRLAEVGEAVKAISPELLAGEATIPGAEVATMRDHIADQDFDTSHSIVAATSSRDLPPLERSVGRLMRLVEDQPPGS
ncbi:MAG: HepT-like ribonuclease domain-containing protein [Candidatus Dormibacteria bacterium]